MAVRKAGLGRGHSCEAPKAGQSCTEAQSQAVGESEQPQLLWCLQGAPLRMDCACAKVWRSHHNLGVCNSGAQ